MAHPRIYKNWTYEAETTWGASYTGNAEQLKIISSSIEYNPNKAAVEDTVTSIRGRDRMTVGRIEVGGDIKMYADPRNIHFAMQMANGVAGTSAALGTSNYAIQFTYGQNVDNNYYSVTANQDRNNSVEKFSGLRATKLNLTASDNLVEMTLSLLGKDRTTGVSVADIVGSTVKPFEFADVKIYVAKPGFTQSYELPVSTWSLDYENNSERSHLSGSRTAARIDGGIPKLTGSMEFFHTGSSFVDPTFGCSELNVRIEATTVSCQGLINGATPYFMRIDIPRVQFTANTRNYEQGALAKETINYEALFNTGSSSLWTPLLVIGSSDI